MHADFTIFPSAEVRVQDHPATDDFAGGRYVWIALREPSGAGLTLFVGPGIFASDEDIAASALVLITAATEILDNARARIAARDELPRDTPLGIEDDVAGEVVAS